MIPTKHHLPIFIVSIFILLSQVIFAEGIAPVEITSLRNANTRVWQTTKIEPEIDLVTGIPTQSQRTTFRYFYEKADGLNYNASTGKVADWRPTVETFQAVQDTSYPYQVNQGSYQIKFNTSVLASYPITYQINGKTMQLGLRELAFYTPQTKTLTPLQSFQASAPTITGNKIRYTNAFSGIDVEYVYNKSRFQQNLIVQSLDVLPNPTQYGLSSTDAYLVSVTEINADNFPCQIRNHKGEGFTNNFLSGENGEILFRDTSNYKSICQFNLSHAIDNQHQQKSMYKHLMQQNGKYYLVEGVPYTWLQTAQYPIVLDYELKTGTSSVNEVWKAGNTYFVSGEYTIGNGNTLVIEPGTVCKFSTECRITAGSGGKIIAKGKPYDYILFTSWKDAANGENVSTYTTPTAGDYSIALYLYPNSSPSTQIEYCKIAYAQYGIDIQTRLDYPIQNNILKNQQVADFWVTQQGSETGDGVTIQNNLILSEGANYGIYLHNGYSYVSIFNNTIDGPGAGIWSVYTSTIAECKNNLISNCPYGAMVSSFGYFGNHSYNRFYNNASTYRNVSAGSNETTITQNPYIVSANGSYYLNQTNTDVINAGDTTVPTYLRKKTTTASNWITTDIATSETWSKVNRDTGKVDIGYHYDPVDYVVGTTNNMVITVSNSDTTARLTILPGVVVSYWRSYSLNTSQILINLGDIVAHGHADDRIRFDSIYATGDSITYALGTNSFSYYKAIRLGAGVGGMETLIQNCAFYHGCAGVFMDATRQNQCYRLFTDNLFMDCNYGIVVIDSFARIYNNLFVSGNNGLYSVYVMNYNHSNDTCYVWNNTMNGNYKAQKGIYASSGSSDVMDIRNNIITGYTEHGIYLCSDYSGTASYNCLYNNATNYYGSFSTVSTLCQNPRFATKGTGQSNDGYYLAQTTGNVSKLSYQQRSLASSNGIDVSGLQGPSGAYTLCIYSFPASLSAGGTLLGNYVNGSGYSKGTTGSGDFMVEFSVYEDGIQLFAGDYITLNYENGEQMRVYFPEVSWIEGGKDETIYLHFWLASDGSVYWGNSSHGAGSVDQDADYSMSYDTSALAVASYSYFSTSPCVNAGDTTIRAYGSTHTGLTKNSKQVDIGYHPLNHGVIQVSELGRLFEYEDGTPFIPIGGNPPCPDVFSYHDIDSWSKVSEYFNWYSAHGMNNLAIGGCSYPPDLAYNHYSNVTDWQSFQKPIGTFKADMFQNFTQLLDYADVNNLTYYLAVLRTQVHNFKIGTSGIQYNHWYSGSTIFYNNQTTFSGVSTPIEVLSSESAYSVQTNTMRYYIDQWGNREGVLYWEPLIEINYLGEGLTNIAAIDTIKREWITKMINFMHQYEIQKFGRKHLVSISCGAANPWPVYTPTGDKMAEDTSIYPDERSWAIAHMPRYPPTITYWYDTTSTQSCFYDHPKLDFVSIHPIIGDGNHAVTFFPLQSLATVGGENSLWYDKTSSQWLVDSAVVFETLAIHSAVNMGFSLMTANIPYLNTEQGPADYGYPYAFRNDRYGDATTCMGTCTVERHIAENLHRAANHFSLYSHMLSGGGGPGIIYSFQPFNWNAPGRSPQSAYTTKNSELYFKNAYRNPLEYNILDDSMFNDQLGMYKVVTSFNWAGLHQWKNQNTTDRLALTSDTGSGVIPFYAGDTDNLMIWLVRNTWSYATATTNYDSALVPLQTVMTVTGFNEGYQYQLTWYNPWTGNSLGTTTFTGPTVTVTAPEYVRDILAIIKPEESD